MNDVLTKHIIKIAKKTIPYGHAPSTNPPNIYWNKDCEIAKRNKSRCY